MAISERSSSRPYQFSNSVQEFMNGSDIPTTILPHVPSNFSNGLSGFNRQGGFDFISEHIGASEFSMPSIPPQSYIPYIFSQSTIEAAKGGFSKNIMTAKGSTFNFIEGISGKDFASANNELISEYEVVFVGQKIQRVEFIITEDIELLKMKLVEYWSTLWSQIENIRMMLMGKYQKFKETT